MSDRSSQPAPKRCRLEDDGESSPGCGPGASVDFCAPLCLGGWMGAKRLASASSLNCQSPYLNKESKDVDQDYIDQLLASEMTEMSFEERANALDEIHGISNEIPETPDFVGSKLDELLRELVGIKSKAAYNMALSMAPDYVQDRKFLIMFLRSKRFDVNMTAKRIISHFELKLELFGAEKLGRPIQMDDLGAEEMNILKKGSYRVLPSMDQTGRLVAVLQTQLIAFKTVASYTRVHFYLMMAIMEDEQAQRKGLSHVFWSHPVVDGVGPSQHNLFFWRMQIIAAHGLPIRWVAYHVCSGGEDIMSFMRLGITLASSQTRARVKIHNGSPMECMYALASYGIPKKILPFYENYELSMDLWRNWIKQRKETETGRLLEDQVITRKQGISQKQEDSMDTSDSNPNHDGEQPGGSRSPSNHPHHEMSVFLGKRLNEFAGSPGNVFLRSLVIQHSSEYDATKSRKKKTAISDSIVVEIRSRGGSFLKFNDSSQQWEEAGAAIARDKVAHAFRNLRRNIKNKSGPGDALV